MSLYSAVIYMQSPLQTP